MQLTIAVSVIGLSLSGEGYAEDCPTQPEHPEVCSEIAKAKTLLRLERQWTDAQPGPNKVDSLARLEEVSESLYMLPSKDAIKLAREVDELWKDYLSLLEDKSNTNSEKNAGLDLIKIGAVTVLRKEARRIHEETNKRLNDAQKKKIAEKEATENAEATKKALDNELFKGFGFGVALGAVIDTGGRDRIDSARRDPNGIVRVEQDSNTRANFMLESHYFFKTTSDFPVGWLLGWLPGECWQDKFTFVKAGQWGWGPFVAIQPGTANIIQAVGIGAMIGWKAPDAISIPKSEGSFRAGNSFNLGVGVMLDVKQRVLGDGIHANQPLPAGETEIRYRETSQIGALILFSYSFY